MYYNGLSSISVTIFFFYLLEYPFKFFLHHVDTDEKLNFMSKDKLYCS